MISFFNFFSALCCASILCYFAYDNYREEGGWINFLNEIENTFLRFMAKFWLTAILSSGFIYFLVKGLLQFIECGNL